MCGRPLANPYVLSSLVGSDGTVGAAWLESLWAAAIANRRPHRRVIFRRWRNGVEAGCCDVHWVPRPNRVLGQRVSQDIDGSNGRPRELCWALRFKASTSARALSASLLDVGPAQRRKCPFRFRHLLIPQPCSGGSIMLGTPGIESSRIILTSSPEAGDRNAVSILVITDWSSLCYCPYCRDSRGHWRSSRELSFSDGFEVRLCHSYLEPVLPQGARLWQNTGTRSFRRFAVFTVAAKIAWIVGRLKGALQLPHLPRPGSSGTAAIRRGNHRATPACPIRHNRGEPLRALNTMPLHFTLSHSFAANRYCCCHCFTIHVTITCWRRHVRIMVFF